MQQSATDSAPLSPKLRYISSELVYIATAFLCSRKPHAELVTAQKQLRLLGVALLFTCLAPNLLAQIPELYFRRNCASCHTIGGGRLTGPDLKGLSERQERPWLADWMLDPEGILQAGDPYAVRLQKESRGAVMPRSPGMNRELAQALLDLIEQESALEESQFAGTQVSDRPLLPQDVAEGEALFSGVTRLKNDGPPCIGCHHLNSLGGLGGGRLGPNLTRAFATLEGRKGLSAWLVFPPGPTMNPVFRDHPLDGEEILPLVAYLKQETEQDETESTAPMVNFLLTGVVGAALLLVIFDLIWSRRFRGVRRALVRLAAER